MKKKDNSSFVDNLLSSAFLNDGEATNPLKKLFYQKLDDSGVTINQAAVNLKIDNKQLEKILDGKLSQLDIIAFEKIASFLEVERKVISEMYFELLAFSHRTEVLNAKNRSYILNTFDLSVLKKIKFIDSISDLENVENRINSFYGFKTIQEFKNDAVSVAYSSGARKSKSGFSKSLWFRTAQASLEGLDNPYLFDREKLIEYIPHIKWNTNDTKHGLFQTIRSLFKLGVTIVYVPSIKDAHVRGATFAINNKPCIAITDYTDFYPTLWFVLLHELFHVLFDWDEILINQYHVSGDDEFFSQNEMEANNFARDYFASEKDLGFIEQNIKNSLLINQFAVQNAVHPSFYYIFYAYKNSKIEPNIWARIRKFMPDIEETLNPLIPLRWDSPKTLPEITKTRKMKIYNL